MAVDSGAIDSPLLLVSGGVVDYKNRPVDRSRCGGWKSASFIIGVEVAERFAYYGISTNLITFLTGPLAQSTATAAANVNAWYGTATLLPLLGAFLADSFLGRYPTIIISSLIYILGLGLLTISAVFTSSSCTPQIQIIFFFFSLYLVAVAQGGHKPCVQAFGADQFDADDPEECKAKGSFFNWWYCCVCGGTTVNLVVLTFIQDNLGWVLGFGIPCIAMAIALILYLLGTTTYRYTINDDDRSPFIRIGQVYVKAIKNWRIPSSELSIDEESLGNLPHHNFQQFKFLNKALLSPDGKKEQVSICSMNDVEEAKSVLRLFPIWASCLGYAIVFAQSPTFFTKQGVTLNRSVGSSFEIPPAALQSFISLSIVIIIPIYDRVLVPCARAVSGKPSGITMLQRIGVGIALSIISMVIAALVEMKRLQTARDYGIVDKPNVTIPMEIWWLVPQYVIFGIADVFTMVGLQEFFYDQVPSELKSIGLALYLSIFGVGSFLSSFLISIIEKTSGCNGQDSWFSDNLNRGHLDYFYWLLGGLSSMSGESQLDDMNVQLIDPNPVAGDQLHSSLLMSMLGTERHRFCCRYRTIFISSFIYILVRSSLLTLHFYAQSNKLEVALDIPSSQLCRLICFACCISLSVKVSSSRISKRAYNVSPNRPVIDSEKLESYDTEAKNATWIGRMYRHQKGLGLLTLSAAFSSSSSTGCINATNTAKFYPPRIQIIFFFFSLYLVAVAQGGHKPCVQAFGADQFDVDNPEECKAKSSFFNWWYFGLCSVTYRFSTNDDEKGPFVRIGQVFLKATKNWKIDTSEQSIVEEARRSLPHQNFQQFNFLNKALISPNGSKEETNMCSMKDVEEAKAVLRLVPIWALCLVYAIVFAQSPTFFTKQGVTLNRSVGSSFEIPPAALQSFITLSIIIIIPIYDGVLVPCARAITGKPSGITMLQRIGVGIVFSIISMVVAALVEMKRLQIARDYGLVDKPDVIILMDIWWMVPQYVLFGIADVFTVVGLQEFFYDQVPSQLKSIGLALYLSIFGVGSFLSSFLISIIEKTSGSNGGDSWFSDNLNRGHLDYFYWILGGLSTVSAVMYLYFVTTYVYNRRYTL
ncbi:hypothetical protein POM88_022040 [Heracleum sosnowskyi]|uniref:Peptide transporter n=1 Tax=Heracleum sosnowskyi TaxID=360622 RepID=A0AAD8IEK4_9APIA|nr:hypothetical protein POM88_022040 [Heracleum sosnowskyi]